MGPIKNRLNAHRTVFHFGDLGDGIQGGIGQEIGGGLVVGEGNEHGVVRRGLVRTGHQFDRTSARCHPQKLPRLDPQAREREGIQARTGLGLQGV